MFLKQQRTTTEEKGEITAMILLLKPKRTLIHYKTRGTFLEQRRTTEETEEIIGMTLLQVLFITRGERWLMMLL